MDDDTQIDIRDIYFPHWEDPYHAEQLTCILCGVTVYMQFHSKHSNYHFYLGEAPSARYRL